MIKSIRWFRYLVGLAVLGVGIGYGVNQFGAVELKRLSAQVEQERREKEKLAAFARRLSASRRAAQIDVIEQRKDSADQTVTTLRWQEIAPDGRLSSPQRVEVVGQLVYFEGLVIKFEPELVGGGDAARGESLVMFRRVFGEAQPPGMGYDLGGGRALESIVGDSDEARLWRLFWQLVDDPRVAAQHGVRVAQVEAPAVPVKKGETWEARIDAAGGINIRKLHAAIRAPG